MNDDWYGMDWDPIGEMSTGVTLSAAELISPQISNWPATAFMEPDLIEPDWLGPIRQPFDKFGQDLWTAGKQTFEQVGEKLPDLLWGWGLRELGYQPRTVDEGAGVRVTYSQAPHAGGEPAQPYSSIIPGMWPSMPVGVAPVQQAKLPSSILLIGAGLVILYIIVGVKR